MSILFFAKDFCHNLPFASCDFGRRDMCIAYALLARSWLLWFCSRGVPPGRAEKLIAQRQGSTAASNLPSNQTSLMAASEGSLPKAPAVGPFLIRAHQTCQPGKTFPARYETFLVFVTLKHLLTAMCRSFSCKSRMRQGIIWLYQSILIHDSRFSTHGEGTKSSLPLFYGISPIQAGAVLEQGVGWMLNERCKSRLIPPAEEL